MSKTKIILLLILILGIIYGALHNSQTQKYIPEEARQVTDQISIDKIPFDQLSNKLSLDKLPENETTDWLKANLLQDAEKSENEATDSGESSVDGASDPSTESTEKGLINEQTSEELNTLKDRATEVGEQTKQVLGASIQPVEEGSDEPKPIYQSAIESGLYYYCKQVVSDYEKQHPTEPE